MLDARDLSNVDDRVVDLAELILQDAQVFMDHCFVLVPGIVLRGFNRWLKTLRLYEQLVVDIDSFDVGTRRWRSRVVVAVLTELAPSPLFLTEQA